MTGAAVRLFPGNEGDPERQADPEILAADIQSKAGRYARLMGHASTAALLAGLAHTHHLKSVPRGGTRR